jgi:hypothetical protein
MVKQLRLNTFYQAKLVGLTLLFSLVCACTFFPYATAQTAAKPPKHIILLVVPGLTEADLRSMSEDLDTLLGPAAFGWMNCRTARIPGQKGDPYAAACLTLGSGARATAGEWAEKPGPLTWERIQRENAKLDHPVPIGALGRVAKLAGLPTKVLGSSSLVRPSRLERLIIETSGSDPHADEPRSNTLTERDPAAPFGIVNDTIFISSIWGDAIGPSAPALSVYVFGDLARCDAYRDLATPTQLNAARAAANLRLITALSYPSAATLPGEENEEQQPPILILLAPAPAPSADPVDRLAPIAIWGGGFKPGLLTSPTTRTSGLVSNTDLVPTVAKFLGVEPPASVTGRPMTSAPLPPNGNFLQRILRKLQGVAEPKTRPSASGWADMHARWLAQSKLQRIFGGLPGLQAGLLALALIVSLAGWRRAKESRTAIAGILAVLPMVQLWLPIVTNQVVPGVSLAVVCLAMTAWLCWRKPAYMTKIVTYACAALCATIALDLVSGANLLRQAWMSYSVMEGARYYGIGNEYGGALLAAGLVCGAAWVSRRAKKRAASPDLPRITTIYHDLPQITLVLGLAVLVGIPGFGADAGGLLSLGVGFGAALLVWRIGRLRAKHVVALIVAAVIVLMGVAALDAMRGAGASHIGRSLGGGALQIALRKASLNFYLLTHSPWALTLLAGTVSVVWGVKSWTVRVGGRETNDQGNGTRAGTPAPPESGTAPTNDNLSMRGYMTGLVVGGITLLALNDSGVVAAAQAFSLGWAGMIALGCQADPNAHAGAPLSEDSVIAEAGS